MCKENIHGEATTDTFCGTPEHIAPEIIKNQQYGKSVDWWSYGVLLYEMLVGGPPFIGNDEAELFSAIANHDIYYPKSLSKDAIQICKAFLTRSPDKRLGHGDNCEEKVKGNSFFRRIEWNKLERREIQPPFKPKLTNPRLAENFDEYFKELNVDLTPRTKDADRIFNFMDGNEFAGFSWASQHFLSEFEYNSEAQEVSPII